MASKNTVLLSIPGLRDQDLDAMPNLSRLMAGGDKRTLVPSFPCVTWPVQTNMLTGKLPAQHGVVANGFFWRESQQVEMWTAWNEKIIEPQIWDLLHRRDPAIRSAVWFPMLSKGCGADYVCMPAPIHNPDGSESLWCYTKPTELYGTLRDELDHFPLKHFWGPLANIKSTAWIVDSAVAALSEFRPAFFYLYLPHLDYAAQKLGPDSELASASVGELDEVIGRLASGFSTAYGDNELVWLAASEYTITPVDHVSYPNRVLRDAGLLQVHRQDDGEHLDLAGSAAWALVDHQFSHVFVKDHDPHVARRVAELFSGTEGFEEVLVDEGRSRYHMNHERSGEVILISAPNSWQAYYWWQDDALAPGYARTVDIHRKPGYDPVELHFDPATMSIPLDANLIRGSHGAPARSEAQQGVLLASQPVLPPAASLSDVDVCELVLGLHAR